MNKITSITLSEEELDTLVSIAIHRAEMLEDALLPAANDAWQEVMIYEERLASITHASDICGGIARVGAIRAAMAAGLPNEAMRLKTIFLAEDSLPQERRDAIERVFQEYQDRLSKRFTALANTGRISEIQEWRIAFLSKPRVFPLAA